MLAFQFNLKVKYLTYLLIFCLLPTGYGAGTRTAYVGTRCDGLYKVRGRDRGKEEEGDSAP